MKENNPIVSVCVISYNSSQCIVETLDSIKKQTYKNIELVISDDCSTDNTIQVCENWLSNNQNRFINSKVVSTTKNTGTSGNLNRGLKICTGEWIKIMAADDLLFTHSIERYMEITNKNHDIKTCISKLDYFGTPHIIEQKRHSRDLFFDIYNTMDVIGKYDLLLKDCLLPMPGMFISKELLELIGFIDEKYPFGEEWPTYMRILEKGFDIPYFEEKLVNYRCSEDALTGTKHIDTKKGVTYVSARRKVFNDSYQFFLDYRKPRLMKKMKYLQVWNQIIVYKMAEVKLKPHLSFIDKIRLMFYRFISPDSYLKIKQYIARGEASYIVNRFRS